jgi:hypothetical protein
LDLQEKLNLFTFFVQYFLMLVDDNGVKSQPQGRACDLPPYRESVHTSHQLCYPMGLICSLINSLYMCGNLKTPSTCEFDCFNYILKYILICVLCLMTDQQILCTMNIIHLTNFMAKYTHIC